MSGEMDQEKIRNFWRRRAALEDNRWTGEELFSYELDLVSRKVPRRDSILDLGCGNGRLGKALRSPGGKVLGVDWEDQYRASFSGPGARFVKSDVTAFDCSETFQLILLFGVVTYLGLDQEERIYQNIVRWLPPEGTCVVKNQCALDGELVVSGHSKELDYEYVGRYPDTDEQAQRLSELFDRVEVVPYEARFNPWSDTRHIAFFCTGRRRAQ